MKQIKLEKLTKEAFAPYGEYYDMLNPEGYALTGPLHSFYPDRLLDRVNANFAFSPMVVKKPEKYIVDTIEYHTTTAEVIFPLTDDIVFHVCQPSGGKVITEQTKAFLVPKGTMVKINAGVWHLCPMPLHDEKSTTLIALPECIYANDLKVANLTAEEQFEIIVD